ncbi:MAG: tRNA lysidine(34) synthetase TilS [Muribaculaceae bacterium]|nr:tRNA lysidine(34) synthetase TilS [Muribaculaceae bacterium]
MMNDKKSIKRIEGHVAEAFESSGVRSLLVAVSGGADSVALLCACARMAPRLGLRVEAANCNFHLRGSESDRDSSFTADLCQRLGIKLHKLDYNVDAYLNEHPGISTEMACRELRYADFFRIAKVRDLDRIAVAHNSDDDIETMLLNMLRGSGSRGLRGMEQDNGKVIRPLLGISRIEIEEYLKAIGRDFITDSSNLTSDYRRNFIRREVVPMLESRWPGARKSLARTLGILKEEADIIEAYYRRQLSEIAPDSSTLLVYEEGVAKGTILRFIEPFGGNPSVADDIFESLDKEFCERRWILSDKYEAQLERDKLVIAGSNIPDSEPAVSWEKIRMGPELMDKIKNNRSHNVIYLPNDESAYELRRPEIGDKMEPLGMRGKRLVSDIISDARLDRSQKQDIRVLVRKTDNKIIWVTTLKRSRHDLVSPDTDFIYKAEITP